MNRRTPINLTTNCCLVHYFKQPRPSSVQLSIFFISSTTLHGLSLKSSSTTAWLSQDFSWPGWVDLYPVLYCTVLYCTVLTPGLLVAWLGGPGGLGVPPRPHGLLLPLLLHLLRSLRRQAQGRCCCGI